ncbi:GRAS family protein [Polyangium aurulentum]|uniref:GRAS family protein n=1 Tax=Polyangium aurulentum TaxID=2567896 RepID=UPI0010AE9621|nr:GRAS family protein [Polyangium aurulentum]UQA59070.1 GRAS family protein [Polyangium aurulentum]
MAVSYPPGPMSQRARRSYGAIMVFTWDDLERYIVKAGEKLRHTPGFLDFFRNIGETEKQRIGLLWGALRALVNDQGEEAAIETEGLIRHMPDEEDGHGAIVIRTFAEALRARIYKLEGSGGNLYLDARPPGAQMRAFELLRLRTPLIPFGYAAANRALLDAVPEPTDVTLLDVGIGRGGQTRALLKNPAARRLFKRLHVIGVEPDSSFALGGALELAQENVLRTAAEVGIEVTFAGIPKLGEHLEVEDIAEAEPRGLLLANACLSLHHVGVPGQGSKVGRDDVLGVIRQAGFSRLVMVEPDSNHYDDDLALRFLYAYRHYGTIARSLYSMLSRADASLVWSEFFAQEVRNVITHDGPRRVERHEEVGRWVERLTSRGWAMDTPPELVAPSAAPPGFTVESRDDACRLAFRGVSVLGVMRAKAVEGAAE